MSIRDDPAPPDCPYCGTPDTVRSSNPHLGRWECTRCSGFFAGTTEEWLRYADQRPRRLREATE